MNKSLQKSIVLITLFALLAGCGTGASAFVPEGFTMEDEVYGEADSLSTVYRAAGHTVPEAAEAVAAKKAPREMSEENDEHMFLLYDDHLVHVMQDSEKPSDSLVEVSDREFVRRHYNPSFLQTYLMFRLVDDLFDMRRPSYGGGTYGGYIGKNGEYAKNKSGSGSIRYGSVGGFNPRGGGSLFGK